MAVAKKMVIGALLFTLLVSGVIYINFQDSGVRIRVDEDKTTFYILNENNRFVVAGREYNRLFDGTSRMNRRASEIEIQTIVNNKTNTLTITRVTPYIRGPIIKDTYFFEGNIDDPELFPISHKVEIINGSGFFYRYSVDDLTGTGQRRKITSETYLEFGRRMKVEFQPGYRWAWVGWPYGSDSFSVQYDIPSDYEVYEVRLFDPIISDLNFSSCETVFHSVDFVSGRECARTENVFNITTSEFEDICVEKKDVISTRNSTTCVNDGTVRYQGNIIEQEGSWCVAIGISNNTLRVDCCALRDSVHQISPESFSGNRDAGGQSCEIRFYPSDYDVNKEYDFVKVNSEVFTSNLSKTRVVER